MTHSETFGRHYSSQARISPSGVAAAVAMHVAVIGLLLSLEVVKLPPEMATLMVQVIQQEAPKPPPAPPKIVPPKPRPVEKQPQPVPQAIPEPQPQIVAAETSAPSSAGEAPPVVQTPPPSPAPAPAPAIIPPGFDADYLDNPAPVYPAMSRRMEESGKTVLRVYVEPNGKPSQIQVRAGSGSARLDQAAQDAVWRWKFVPARRGEEAIGAWVLVPIVFNLKG